MTYIPAAVARRTQGRSAAAGVAYGVVAVRPGAGLGDGGDDLEGGHDRDAAQRPVRRGGLPGPGDARGQVLLAQGAERRSAGMAVEGDQQAAGEQDLPAAGQLGSGPGDRDPGRQQAGRPEAGPDGEHLPGLGGPERGDGGRVGARVVAVHGDHPGARRPRGGDRRQRRGAGGSGAHEQRHVAQRGRGCAGARQLRRVGYHADTRQLGRQHLPGDPGREHGQRMQRADPRPQRGVRPRLPLPPCPRPSRPWSATAARARAGPTWPPPPAWRAVPDGRRQPPARRRTTRLAALSAT